MSPTSEQFQFQAETKELLQLMIHSVYSNKEIFLRELISNAADALDKRRILSLSDAALLPADERLQIEIACAPGVLTVSDNGVGMSREDLIRLLGTIAESGTRAFAEAFQKEQQGAADLIGRFGVGFYASFMVADEVVVTSRKVSEAQGHEWRSLGDGTYSIAPVDNAAIGTSIQLKLKHFDAEESVPDFTDPAVIKRVVKKHSDFVTYPVVMKEAPAEPINSMRPVWSKAASEISQQEYEELYRRLSHDFHAPLKSIPLKAEGTFEYQSLLFIPEKAPYDLFFRDGHRGLHLYVKRVLIDEKNEELLPLYLRFVRGVVDASDLPLNVSREMLQHNRQLAHIRKRLTKKVVDTLVQMAESEEGSYRMFWQEFGAVIKEGIGTDEDNREKLLELLRFRTARSGGELRSLQAYVSAMSPDQKQIYYLNSENYEQALSSPHLEALNERGFDVFIMTDPVDEVVMQHVTEYAGKPFKSIHKGAFDLDEKTNTEAASTEDKTAKVHPQQTTFASLLTRMAQALEAQVKEVRLTSRLRTSVACLVSGEDDLSPYFAKLLEQSQKGSSFQQKRILELNPEHPILKSLLAEFTQNPASPMIPDYAQLLYGQAQLSEGTALDDAAQFCKLMTQLMTKANAAHL